MKCFSKRVPGVMGITDSVALQQAYYEATARSYDAAHTEDEHFLALHVLAAYIDMAEIQSILDVGAGTGRAMRFLRRRFPNLTIKGVEPVTALRRQGHAQGIPEADLVEGDGEALPFAEGSFDLVCEFAVLHHVRRPEAVVAEMTRVARKMIAISDCNFMGQGPTWLRVIKAGIWGVGLWPAADRIKTRGKGYTYSEGDGIAYSYSVFQNFNQVRQSWSDVKIFPTSMNSASLMSPLLGAGNVLLIAQNRRTQW